MCQCDNGAKFAPLINAYVIIYIHKNLVPRFGVSGMHTVRGERRTHRRPFFSCTAAEPSGEMQPADNGQMGAGANGTGENERGAKVLNISLSCCEL